MRRVLAITPARDEEKLLPGLISSMTAQTYPPQRWVVIDDGSADRTGEILDDAAKRYRWLEPHHLPRNRSRAPGGESVIMQFLPRDEWATWDYLLRLDADVTFAPDLIEKLLAEFARDPTLGVAGPIMSEPCGSRWQEVKTPSFHTRGPAKMYSRQCFSAIGGLEAGLGWDAIDELQAIMLGFKSRHFRHIHAYHHRQQGSAGGILGGRFRTGLAAYRVGYSPLFMLARAAANLWSPPRLLGSAMMLAGYFDALVRRLPQAAPPELIRFIRRQQLRRLLRLETVWR
jgi:poly-beta-1,6-N-acetyl-D-glucosamine synthase